MTSLRIGIVIFAASLLIPLAGCRPSAPEAAENTPELRQKINDDFNNAAGQEGNSKNNGDDAPPDPMPAER